MKYEFYIYYKFRKKNCTVFTSHKARHSDDRTLKPRNLKLKLKITSGVRLKSLIYLDNSIQNSFATD